MRQRHLAGLATATVIALGAGFPAPALAAADGSTLYVNPGAGCTDAGSGTQAAPYCTVQAAVDAAQPGQTVQVAAAHYREQVTLTHSGAPGKPITISGGNIRDGLSSLPLLAGAWGGPAPDRGFVLDGVHDIKITGFGIGGSLEGVLLSSSQDVVLEGNYIGRGSQDGIRLTGTTSSTTVSRNIVNGHSGTAVVVEAGVGATVLTTNAIDNQAGGGGIRITDAPGTIVTSNTVSSVCGPAIGLFGNSSKAVVKNNVLAVSSDTMHSVPSCSPGQDMAKLSVSAASVPGTSADYNLANPSGNARVYNWAGTSYANASDFAAAVAGQGAHDITADPRYSGNADTNLPIWSDSPGVDSADAAAPGELTTDLYGYQRIDDPYVTNTGTGPGHYDRGAFEYTTAARWVGVTAGPAQIPAGAATTISVRDQETWSPVVSYTYDFGDGTPTVSTTEKSVQHTYRAVGAYKAVVVATMQNGDATRASSDTVTVSAPGPITPAFALTRSWRGRLDYNAVDSGSTSPWTITSRTFDFGDGSAPVTITSGTGTDHVYLNQGDYTVTMTVTDAGGRSQSTSQVLHARYPAGAYYPMAPARAFDSRGEGGALAPGATRTLQLLSGRLPFTHEPTAVVLNVTAVDATAPGHLTVYPSGANQPQTSSVNYTAGHAVPNLVTVPVGPTGDVQITNSWGASVNVVVDVSGYYSGTAVAAGAKFTPLTPARLVDTRRGDTGGTLRTDATRNVKIAGTGGVPADATAVVLNLTGTNATEETHLDVYPGGADHPNSSNLNPAPGQDRANQVIVPLGPDGTINVYNHSGSTDFVLDVFGYYSADGKGLFNPTAPTRLLDTRNPKATLGTNSQLTLPVAGSATVPANATGAVLNITTTNSTDPGYVTVFPSGQSRPGTSNLNTQPGVDVPNHVTTPLGANGSVSVYNHLGNDDIVADLFGYFTNS